MSRSEYYRQMQELARDQRQLFKITGARVLKSHLRKIFRHYDVQVDLWPPTDVTRSSLRHLRGAYLNNPECGGPCVMISRNLPDEPQIFTMAHELKHHLVDQEQLTSFCHDKNMSDMHEIGAEVFAAELIYPQQLFIEDLTEMGVTRDNFQPKDLVDLKRRTKTTMPYAGLAKRAVFLRYSSDDDLKGIKWKKLEVSLYGEPDYKRFLAYRRARS